MIKPDTLRVTDADSLSIPNRDTGPGNQTTYNHVDELLEAGFPEKSFLSDENLFDSARIIDSLGYKKGLKMVQDKYG